MWHFPAPKRLLELLLGSPRPTLDVLNHQNEAQRDSCGDHVGRANCTCRARQRRAAM